MITPKQHCALIVLAVVFAHSASAESSFGKSAFGTSGSSFNRERGAAPATQSDTKSIAPATAPSTPTASAPATQAEAPAVAVQVPPQSAPRSVAVAAPVQSPTAKAVTAAVVATLDVVASGYATKSSDGKRIRPPAGVTPGQLKSAQDQAKIYQRELANYRPPAVGSSD